MKINFVSLINNRTKQVNKFDIENRLAIRGAQPFRYLC
jgi:hypothetical protein